ncbi:hypothetical protein GGR51DRAFT_88089 [Nemania sp. FL0031]|nr:hypothetical protein GGR51DRAFT_88089 [Nemania sp. FL0031]
MADADICTAASRLLMCWGNAFDANTQRQRDGSASVSFTQTHAHPHSHATKSSPSPSFSAESSESYPLSRSSSISSLYSTAASTCESDSDSDDEDDEDDKFILVSILKKPRRRYRNTHSQAQQRHHQFDSSRNYPNDGGNHYDNGDYYYTDDRNEGACYEDDEDEDDESECDIVFERNVTFNDPLATDIITGDPIEPSPLSRLEWTALRARECLEREREEFGKFDDAWREFEEQEQGAFQGRSLEEELQALEDEEIPTNWRRHLDIDMHDDKHKELGYDEDRESMRLFATEAKDIVPEITEAAVQHVAQGQQRQQRQQ